MPVLTDVSLPEAEITFLGATPPKKPPPTAEEGSFGSEGEQSRTGNESEETELVSLDGPGTFHPSSYIDLTSRNICRAVYKVRINSTSGWIPLVCGRTDCSFHSNAKDFGSPRIYVRQPKGQLHHGRMDLPSYSKKEFKEKVEEFEKMVAEDALRAQGTAADSSSSKTAKKNAENPGDNRKPAARRTHIELGANTTYTTPPRNTSKLPGTVARGKIFYGLESIDGERELLEDQTEALEWAEEVEWEVRGMWTDPMLASTWVSSAPALVEKVPTKEHKVVPVASIMKFRRRSVS